MSVPSVYAFAAAALLGGVCAAHGGPCSVEIAQVEQQIARSGDNPNQGPSAPESRAATLGRQPTPQSVREAERAASALVIAALDRARKADADGNAAVCAEELRRTRELYGLPQ